jgi:hypothetical protein
MSITPRRRRDGTVAYQVRVSIDGRRLPAARSTPAARPAATRPS